MNARPLLAALLAASVTGCSGEPLTIGLNEPLQVQGGQFRTGALPGMPPLTAEQAAAGGAQNPRVTSIGLARLRVTQGESGFPLAGRTSAEAEGIGIRFADAGSGWWVIPIGGPDPVNAGELTFDAPLDISRQLRPGRHPLRIVAIDSSGRAGTQSEISLCVGGLLPDNYNACDPTIAPPSTIVSLSWDAPVDLDLRVVTPTGKVVDAKRPSTAERVDGEPLDPTAPGVGVLDRDSNPMCVVDGVQLENLVFQEQPAPGNYVVYARLFDACGQQSVRFKVALHQRAPGAAPGTFTQAKVYEQTGILNAIDADGGAGLGLYVTYFQVQ